MKAPRFSLICKPDGTTTMRIPSGFRDLRTVRLLMLATAHLTPRAQVFIPPETLSALLRSGQCGPTGPMLADHLDSWVRGYRQLTPDPGINACPTEGEFCLAREHLSRNAEDWPVDERQQNHMVFAWLQCRRAMSTARTWADDE